MERALVLHNLHLLAWSWILVFSCSRALRQAGWVGGWPAIGVVFHGCDVIGRPEVGRQGVRHWCWKVIGETEVSMMRIEEAERK